MWSLGDATDPIVNNTFRDIQSDTNGMFGAAMFNQVYDNYIYDSVLEGAIFDVWMNDTSGTNYYINSTVDRDEIRANGTGSILDVSWYARAQVIDENSNPLDGANLSVYNSTNDFKSTDLTDATGFVTFGIPNGAPYWADAHEYNYGPTGIFKEQSTYTGIVTYSTGAASWIVSTD